MVSHIIVVFVFVVVLNDTTIVFGSYHKNPHSATVSSFLRFSGQLVSYSTVVTVVIVVLKSSSLGGFFKTTRDKKMNERSISL